ncbi:hypothetical protein B0H17DRAFT_1100462 [Mycena rosella]|uniref:Uncharacterized protein n=1 Tax=Mycena rosella TaxID=1033263 RepID=A0AAD7CMS1_MYCRO|nr:hypothetical protein B0H17DRAFT_1100462 [Mycena rosella]
MFLACGPRARIWLTADCLRCLVAESSLLTLASSLTVAACFIRESESDASASFKSSLGRVSTRPRGKQTCATSGRG